jgi:hypothetical protein
MGLHMGPPEASVGYQHAHKLIPPGLGEPAVCWRLRHKKMASWVVAAHRHVEDPSHEATDQEV